MLDHALSHSTVTLLSSVKSLPICMSQTLALRPLDVMPDRLVVMSDGFASAGQAISSFRTSFSKDSY